MGIMSAYVFPHPPIIVPAVGCGEEAPASKTIESCRALVREIVATNADALVVSSPHAYLVPDGFYFTTSPKLTGSMMRFGVPNTTIDINVDSAFTQAVIDEATQAGIRIIGSAPQAIESYDHGTYVPIYFIAEAYAAREGVDVTAGVPDGYELPVPVVRLGMSGLSGEAHDKLGRIIARVADELGRKAIYIASGDCAHKLSEDGPYGFTQDAVELENAIVHALDTGNLEELFAIDPRIRSNGGDCGTRSFQIMAGAVSHMNYACELLSEEAPFGIGYCVAAIRPKAG